MTFEDNALREDDNEEAARLLQGGAVWRWGGKSAAALAPGSEAGCYHSRRAWHPQAAGDLRRDAGGDWGPLPL